MATQIAMHRNPEDVHQTTTAMQNGSEEEQMEVRGLRIIHVYAFATICIYTFIGRLPICP